jgi:hypothetical protein
MTPSNSLLANRDSSLQIRLPNKKVRPRLRRTIIQSDRNNFPEKLLFSERREYNTKMKGIFSKPGLAGNSIHPQTFLVDD